MSWLGAFGRWRRAEDGPRASKGDGDPHTLDREGDPRGGVQDPTYRASDPRDVVEVDGIVMSGPAGAPQEGRSVEERRETDDLQARIAEDRPTKESA